MAKNLFAIIGVLAVAYILYKLIQMKKAGADINDKTLKTTVIESIDPTTVKKDLSTVHARVTETSQKSVSNFTEDLR